MPPAHGGIVLAVPRLMAKIAPPVDDLFGRSAADSQLQTPACNEIRGAGILCHVIRVLIPHVDHGRADFNAPGPRRGRGQQRERRGQLPREMMHTKVRSVHPRPLGLNGKVNRLKQRIRRASRF